MKHIPLHSLVMIINRRGFTYDQDIISKFENYEIVDVAALKHQLFGDRFRKGVDAAVWDYAKLTITSRLKAGGRVVVLNGNMTLTDTRIAVARCGKELGIPVFYVLTDIPTTHTSFLEKIFMNTYDEEYSQIMWGDGIAEVISDEFEPIAELPRFGTVAELKRRGFGGLTIIGDIHGKVEPFLHSIDWARRRNHFIVMLGDIIDYGPNSTKTMEEAHSLITRGLAVNVIGNHESKIFKWMNGQTGLFISAGNKTTIAEYDALSENHKQQWAAKMNGIMTLGAHHWLFDNISVAHAAVSPKMMATNHKTLSNKLESFAMYGEVVPKASGKPTSTFNWCDEVPADNVVVVGHQIRNDKFPMVVDSMHGGKTVFLDTGSGKGGVLSCLDIAFADMKIGNFFQY